MSQTGLSLVTLGLGWDPADRARWTRGRKRIDLNAAAMLFAGHQLVDVVYHEQLFSQDGAVRLLGDSTDGEGDGDDEIITVDLTRITPVVTAVVFLMTSYTGQTMDEVQNSYCRLVDGVTGEVFAHYVLKDPAHGFLAGELVRGEAGWQYREIATAIDAQHPVEAIQQLDQYLP
ncbi:TerD family protein [Nocardia shimofusensis]|uniref:TerD family protein n=1 Tax=Nocardia shimofusensis TaxID=228596 RepID=UPI000A60537D|nr:TerD family protein [Nocardia shimofusensis]